MKRANVKIKCPYFRRLGKNSVICEGVVIGGSITVGLESYAARERWVLSCCAGSKERCPVARMLSDPARVYDPVDYDCGREGAALRRVTVVLRPEQLAQFGVDGKLTLVGGIYDALFGRLYDGEPFFCTLIPAGERVGEVFIAHVVRLKRLLGWVLYKG